MQKQAPTLGRMLVMVQREAGAGTGAPPATPPPAAAGAARSKGR